MDKSPNSKWLPYSNCKLSPWKDLILGIFFDAADGVNDLLIFEPLLLLKKRDSRDPKNNDRLRSLRQNIGRAVIHPQMIPKLISSVLVGMSLCTILRMKACLPQY